MAFVLTVYYTVRVPPLLTTTQDSLPLVVNLYGWDWLPTETRGFDEEFLLGASPPPGLDLAPDVLTHHSWNFTFLIGVTVFWFIILFMKKIFYIYSFMNFI